MPGARIALHAVLAGQALHRHPPFVISACRWVAPTPVGRSRQSAPRCCTRGRFTSTSPPARRHARRETLTNAAIFVAVAPASSLFARRTPIVISISRRTSYASPIVSAAARLQIERATIRDVALRAGRCCRQPCCRFRALKILRRRQSGIPPLPVARTVVAADVQTLRR